MLRTLVLRTIQVFIWLLIPVVILVPFALVVLGFMNGNSPGTMVFHLLLWGNVLIGSGFWAAGRMNELRMRIDHAIHFPPLFLSGPVTPERLTQIVGEKPLFVYLRAFRGDGSVHREPASPSRSSFHPVEVFTPVKTYEMLLASLYREHGELLAIGRPGELLPPTGFRRAYVDEQSWREWVDLLLSTAVQVIVEVGRSRNLLWEMERALDSIPSDRLTLVLHERTTPDGMAAAIAMLRTHPTPAASGPTFLYIDREGAAHRDRVLDTAVWRAFRMPVRHLLEQASRIHQCSRCDATILAGRQVEHLGRMLCPACHYNAMLDQGG